MDVFEPITYLVGCHPEPGEAVEVFVRSGLEGAITDPQRMARLLETADVLVCAYAGERLVGLARGLTDFLYVCYLSDLVVDAACQGQGVGRELIRRVQEAVGPEVAIHLFAAPAAQSYYEHLGCERATDCFRVPRAPGDGTSHTAPA